MERRGGDWRTLQGRVSPSLCVRGRFGAADPPLAVAKGLILHDHVLRVAGLWTEPGEAQRPTGAPASDLGLSHFWGPGASVTVVPAVVVSKVSLMEMEKPGSADCAVGRN